MNDALLVLTLSAGLLPAPQRGAEAAEPNPASIRGVVVDARTGQPLGEVFVQIVNGGEFALTGEDGRFSFEGLAPGRHEIYVSAVGYALLRREVEVEAGPPLEILLPLSEGTGSYAEQVTVRAAPFEEREGSVPAQELLGSGEIQSLRGSLLDDPLRAVQTLPGVAAGDDFHALFSVRGSDFRHMGFSLDGIPTPFLLHTVQGVEGSGSVTMFNSELLESLSLLHGSYPQRYGNRTGAQLDFVSREGSRDRRHVRGSLSGTSASVVAEGPLGSSKRGSFLVSARKSYLDALLNYIFEDETFVFGFEDAQSKLVFDLSNRHQLQLNTLVGRSRYSDSALELGGNEAAYASNRGFLANLTWRYTPGSSLLLTQRLYAVGSEFENVNRDEVLLDKGIARDLGYRVDVTYTPAPTVLLEAGGQVQQLQEARSSYRESLQAGTFEPQELFDTSGSRGSAYGALRFTPAGGWSLSPGARIDHWGLTAETTVSPWLQAEWRGPGSVRVKLGAGLYQQYPSFEQVTGLRGSVDLRPERAWHYDLAFERVFSRDTRFRVTLYDREERDVVRLPESEIRREGDEIRPPDADTTYQNALDGYSRGVEVLLQQRNPNGLSGWLSYALGYTRYRDRFTGERFWGDFDQRHTLNAYVHYRWSDRTSVSLKYRAGSNFPIPGYWEYREPQLGPNFGALAGPPEDPDGPPLGYVVSDERNRTRLPFYSRLDLRANRTFAAGQRARLTLFVEVTNVFNRENQRPGSPSVNVVTGRVTDLTESLFPIVPSAGLLVEF